jgi:hypothetical protein
MTESLTERNSVRYIGKRELLENEKLDEYLDLSTYQIERIFNAQLVPRDCVDIARKYTYDRSYLAFVFLKGENVYNVIHQRDGRGNNCVVSSYIIEAEISEIETFAINRISLIKNGEESASCSLSQEELEVKVRSICEELHECSLDKFNPYSLQE